MAKFDASWGAGDQLAATSAHRNGELTMNADTYVIVGASLAGAKAAETLRAEGFDGPLVLVGEEAERPYERPGRLESFVGD